MSDIEDSTGDDELSLADLIPAPELRHDLTAWPKSPYTLYELLLLHNIKTALPELKKLQSELGMDSLTGAGCDGVYRFYHSSYKVYWLQRYTHTIVDELEKLAPRIVAEDKTKDLEIIFSSMFLQIVRDGIGQVFDYKHNMQWLKYTRPIVEAFFHTKFFLDLVIIAGETLELPQLIMDEGWACILELYNMR